MRRTLNLLCGVAGRRCRASRCCGRCCRAGTSSWEARPWPSASSSAAPPPSCPTGTPSAPSGSRHAAGLRSSIRSRLPLQTQHRMVVGGDVLQTRYTGGMAAQGRVRTLALSESSREDVISSVKDFLNPKAYYQVGTPHHTPFLKSARTPAGPADTGPGTFCDGGWQGVQCCAGPHPLLRDLQAARGALPGRQRLRPAHL